MKILIDIGHPCQVHFFRNLIFLLEKKGHKVLVTSKKKDITEKLLQLYKINYKQIGTSQIGILKKIIFFMYIV